MSKEIIAAPTLEAKGVAQLSIESVKQSFFEHMTPLEMMLLMYRIEEDLMCSSITDEDTTYRGEIKVFFTSLGKLIIGLKNNQNPNGINLIELICRENID